jgi:hypothetical protein
MTSNTSQSLRYSSTRPSQILPISGCRAVKSCRSLIGWRACRRMTYSILRIQTDLEFRWTSFDSTTILRGYHLILSQHTTVILGIQVKTTLDSLHLTVQSAEQSINHYDQKSHSYTSTRPSDTLPTTSQCPFPATSTLRLHPRLSTTTQISTKSQDGRSSAARSSKSP